MMETPKNQKGFIPLIPILIAVVVGTLVGASAGHISKQHKLKLPAAPISAKKLPAVPSQNIAKPKGVDVTKPVPKPPSSAKSSSSAASTTSSNRTPAAAVDTIRTFVNLIKQGDYNGADYYVTTPFMFGMERLAGHPDATNADLVSSCNSSFVCPILISSLSIGDSYNSSPYVGTHNESGLTISSNLSNVSYLASTVTGNKNVTVSLIYVDGRWLIDNASIAGTSLY